MDDTPPLKGRGQVTSHIFGFDAHNYISGTAEARVAKYCIIISLELVKLVTSNVMC